MRLTVPAPVYPCALTVAGLAAGLMGASALSSGEVAVGVLWVLLGQLLDIADGWVARRLGAETRWGALLDYHTDAAVTVALLAAMGAWPLVGGVAVLQTWAVSSQVRVSGRMGAAILATFVALGGCGPTSNESATEVDEACSAIAGASDDKLASFCAEHPWAPPNCGGAPAPDCLTLLAGLDCETTLCEYAACAKAIAHQDCGDPRPRECMALIECLS